MEVVDILLIILAIFLPPVSVFLKRGCDIHLLINILLWIFTWIGGVIHAIWVLNSKRTKNFLIVDNKTKLGQVEEAFREFTAREDLAILLISQHVANDIRHLLDEYDRLLPTVLEIPSKGAAYDMAKDSLMTKVLRMLGTSADAPDIDDESTSHH
ncbi:vacuolar ATP synthase subunit F, putative [Acanthamoeba castellanii str. Neff]|uniref:Vacuolar ATP synthase subunit F, putative n=1 Tax=Acanthamoeba castellanii (strain ATCC 30010 / Neff) TaxID=1257118 RepID=L8H0Q0_ACACF|nr:vacuolar ATP synthase subunit F, putative [Acanthamoeba castellanii str. Neff]ELR18797.1 vacuolar ATP synthase subunit F, putative [Acanthamoeba castellanii str. Neff]